MNAEAPKKVLDSVRTLEVLNMLVADEVFPTYHSHSMQGVMFSKV